jgi:aldose 1-epimerase
MRLAAGDWTLAAAPDRGGAILSLRHRGRDILRPTRADVDDPLDCACFPLVPYANRIADGTFDWAGETHRLPRNHPAQAHPLHGVGWRRAWSVTAADARAVTMRLVHGGDAAWPWPFVAWQRLALSPHGLTATLEIVGDGDRAMPVSLGFHPCFAAAETLAFTATGMWQADAAMLPTVPAAADALGDWRGGGALSRADLVDHCYTGWNGTATIARRDGDVVLSAQGTPALHVFVPSGASFFCAEPVTAMPDAVNRGAAAPLAPGARMQIAMRIAAA